MTMTTTPGPLQADPKIFVTRRGTALGRLLNFREICELTRLSAPGLRFLLAAKAGPPVIQRAHGTKIFAWEGCVVEWLSASGGSVVGVKAGRVGKGGVAKAKAAKRQSERAYGF